MRLHNIVAAAVAAAAVAGGMTAQAKDFEALRLNPSGGTQATLTMPSGEKVSYTTYEGNYYVTNVEDSVYQTLNIYVPEQLRSGDETPIFLRTYIGGYMAATAKTPSATDATCRALKEGYVVCINF